MKKVLIVDDSPMFRTILQKKLNKLGFEDVDIAEGGVSGVWESAANNYDVVLMDMHMPDLDGINAIRGIRTEDEDTPIILITGETDETKLNQAIEAGANAYVNKPVDAEDLKKKILEVCGD